MVTIGIPQVNSDNFDITTVTYGGVSLTEAFDASNYVAGDWYHIWVWSLVAPATGANTLAILLAAWHNIAKPRLTFLQLANSSSCVRFHSKPAMATREISLRVCGRIIWHSPH